MKIIIPERINKNLFLIINVSVSLLLLLLLWFIYNLYAEDIRFVEHEEKIIEVSRLEGEIRFYDEVLSMSARMAVITGDEKWEQRYRETEEKLEKNLEKAKVFFPDELIIHLEKTNVANEKLIELENKAFELINIGENKQAEKLLFSDRYNSYKKQYSLSVSSLYKSLNNILKVEEEITSSKVIQYLFSSIFITLVFVVAWTCLNIILFRGRISLDKKELFIQGILENAVDGIISIDKKGIILSVNPATKKLFGYDESEMLGENIKMLMPSLYHDGNDGYLSNYHKTGDKKVIGGEVIGRRKDGSTFPMELSVSENKIGESHSFTYIVRDISERVEKEQQIVDQKDYYENLFKYLNVPAFILDNDHKVVMWNKACEALTGTMSSDLLGTQNSRKALYVKEHPLLADLVLDETYDDPELYPVEIEDSIMPNGKRVQNWVDLPLKSAKRFLTLDAGPIFDANGERTGVLQVMQDITSMKELEESIQENNEQLKRSNEELDRFAYVASHDLQEPLRMVSSYTQLLSNRYKDKLDDDANEFMDYIVGGAKRMQLLIQDLLSFSRLSSKVEVLRPIEANHLYDNAIGNLAVAIDESGTVVTKEDLPVIHGDEGQLRQLFQNLIGNAVKYRDPEKMNKVHVSVKELSDSYQFCFEDNGIGIEANYFEKIFVIFQRLHGKDKYQGTGIGLSLCKKIVDNHHGRIWVESEYGQGTRFNFTLPMH